MGIPYRYSLDLPERCLQLIRDLLPEAAKSYVAGQEDLGPLTTTFLLAMSAPMITLPVERLERHLSNLDEGYVDDRFLAPQESEAIRQTLRRDALGQAPFFEAGTWAFASVSYRRGVNLAREIPEEALTDLASKGGLLAAERMPASQWASCLRNALSHGGVFYLDHEGRQTVGRKAEKLAFGSGKYTRGSDELERLNFVSIAEVDYLRFLERWVAWLKASGTHSALAAE
ncbi:hypothetical protein [Phenylobacterium sp.]|uniref:hypothetical protein n=1 Tax=Phenylobacterium sp. TaxID=1871053 RepID=UPI0030F4A2EC